MSSVASGTAITNRSIVVSRTALPKASAAFAARVRALETSSPSPAATTTSFVPSWRSSTWLRRRVLGGAR